MRRFKTGTPARIYRDSIDFSKMEIQLGDNSDRFSFMSPRSTFVEEPCYLTYTNEKRTNHPRQHRQKSALQRNDFVDRPALLPVH